MRWPAFRQLGAGERNVRESQELSMQIEVAGLKQEEDESEF